MVLWLDHEQPHVSQIYKLKFWNLAITDTVPLSFPLAVKCAESELTRFNVPAGTSRPWLIYHRLASLLTRDFLGQTCAEYAGPFLATAVGYLANGNATSNCGYCAMSNGGEYALPRARQPISMLTLV